MQVTVSLNSLINWKLFISSFSVLGLAVHHTLHYDRLWKVENPRDELAAIREAKNCDALTAMKEMINPDSLNVLPCCYIEKYAAGMQPLSYLQFQRIGYFNVDKDSTPEKMVFNRTVGLKDVWGKINK